MVVLVFLLVFMGIVLIHELGHFVFAKVFGVRILEFAIGFGPALYRKKFGETTFRVNVFPLGGYVRLSGEDPYEASEEDAGRRFYDKPAWQRLLIALSGPLFSIIAGYVIFVLVINLWGVRLVGVDRVIENTPAWNAGLKSGDLILKLNGKFVFDNLVISQEIRKGKEIELLVLRDGEKLNLRIKPELIPPEMDLWISSAEGTPAGELEQLNGLESPGPEDLNSLRNEFIILEFSESVVKGILKDYAYIPERFAIGFVFAGLSNVFKKDRDPFRSGDLLKRIDDLDIDGWLDLIRAYRYLQLSGSEIYIEIMGKDLSWWKRGSSENVRVEIVRDGERMNFNLPKKAMLTILEDPSSFEPQVPLYKPENIFERIELAIDRCNWILGLTWRFISGLSFFKGIASGEVAGPVGIAGAVGEAVKLGMDTVLSLVAIITINLGLFNLLPLPALDGGRIVFSLVEMITGRRIDPKIEALIHTIGFMLLMALLFYITLADIGRMMGM